MQAKPIFLLTGVIGLFFGISLLLFPEMILNLIEVTFLNAGPAMARHTGAWVLAAGVFVLLIRNEEHSNLRQSVFIFLDIALTLMAVVELLGFFMALGGIMLIVLAALHVLLAIAYTYLYMINR
jgi:hypothetical protein